ncbi:hypothetical protein GLOIN_2v1873925 [Rhizophagus irregularis DAOM 181602=DAOM 197198]|uniref:Uncharacterized protein n=1 Tax=Rhizophagus irregularis (strain DAOM 181602 / DAOM 197198 / MUCL 43194) TaxID=747089 RepID=A0A2P4Q8M9_RHIID|nr:hypothetical protein GLOIN_2v1873925 [Rhizophagus irregularis DAOM 181602=DAOM 197198]POG74003.1 hypothetical protein GLOIN_2v1873925 [Rhizophagus irregularis DAOM 181602=DAOM 197198]CAG8609872.1 497_t:CDS:2 [Rhizophagus irregularis]|eukprot:XP_025180869.1 hypothetical protein GLOIN_2v1873925 [Rhizophagus irregularis DAOM 181602=DAOM 197198]
MSVEMIGSEKSAQNRQASETQKAVICMVGNDQWRSDAGAWFQWPSYENYTNLLRIIVFYNRDPDHKNALEKIDKVQHDLDSIFNIEFVTIALPDRGSHFYGNPNLGAISILANPTSQNTRPYLAPYLIHWNANNIPVYYIVNWNHHVVLKCGILTLFLI